MVSTVSRGNRAIDSGTIWGLVMISGLLLLHVDEGQACMRLSPNPCAGFAGLVRSATRDSAHAGGVLRFYRLPMESTKVR